MRTIFLRSRLRRSQKLHKVAQLCIELESGGIDTLELGTAVAALIRCCLNQGYHNPSSLKGAGE